MTKKEIVLKNVCTLTSSFHSKASGNTDSIFSKIFQADFMPQQFRNSRKYRKAWWEALKEISWS